MRKIFLLLVLLVTVNLFAEEVKFYQTSYDCKKVKEGSVEYKICTVKGKLHNGNS